LEPALKPPPTLEIQMSVHGKPPVASHPLPDSDYGIVLHAYLQLPLFRRQQNGCWIAPLKRFDACELRLVEGLPGTIGEPVLRVELFDPRRQAVIESRPCEELEEAVAALKAMIPSAEAYAVQGGTN
jgi:hypothetical protein